MKTVQTTWKTLFIISLPLEVINGAKGPYKKKKKTYKKEKIRSPNDTW